MAKKKRLPEVTDEIGNLNLRNLSTGIELDFSGFGVDGEERITYSSDSFSQGPESDFDEFH